MSANSVSFIPVCVCTDNNQGRCMHVCFHAEKNPESRIKKVQHAVLLPIDCVVWTNRIKRPCSVCVCSVRYHMTKHIRSCLISNFAPVVWLPGSMHFPGFALAWLFVTHTLQNMERKLEETSNPMFSSQLQFQEDTVLAARRFL